MATTKNRGYSVSKSITTQAEGSGSTEREKSQYDGLWLNPTITFVVTDDDGNEVDEHIRFPRGVAVSDLFDFKIYPNTDPGRAKRLRKVNSILQAIRNKGLDLGEGESIRVKGIDLRLYRRQEVQEHVVGTEELEALDEALFGDD